MRRIRSCSATILDARSKLSEAGLSGLSCIVTRKVATSARAGGVPPATHETGELEKECSTAPITAGVGTPRDLMVLPTACHFASSRCRKRMLIVTAFLIHFRSRLGLYWQRVFRS